MPSGAPMPRIAVLVSTFPGLSQTFVLDQVGALRSAGFDVQVFARTRSESDLDHRKSRELLALGSYADQHPLLRMFGASHLPARLRESGKELIYRRFQQRALADFDLVLCHFGNVGLGTALRARRLRSAAPIWTIFHGHDLSRFVRQHPDDVYRPLFEIGSRFLPVSRLWERTLVDLGCPADRIELLRMGVDCEAIAFRPSDRRPGEPVRILTVGRLVEKKGTEFSLRALARLAREAGHLDWTFEIVGEGPLEPELRTLAARLKLHDRVRFLGPLPVEEVRTKLHAADVFVLPSVVAADGDMEGIPVALMEAMAAGVPVISSAHSGIPELIEHGVSGLLAAERDVAGLAAHLGALIESPEAGRSLIGAARRKVETEFNQARVHDRLIRSIRAAPHVQGAARSPGPPAAR